MNINEFLFSDLPDTKILRCQFTSRYKFTGRQLTSKLVISKNKDDRGNNTTLIFAYKNGRYYFIPITDIYLDVNRCELIMPKSKPVPIAEDLVRDIIPSRKYQGCYVLAPDSDFEPIFKEAESPDGLKTWCLVFDEITLHLYTWTSDYDRDEIHHTYLSTHEKNEREKEEWRKERKRNQEINREAQRMTDELFEEAGYDFMD